MLASPAADTSAGRKRALERAPVSAASTPDEVAAWLQTIVKMAGIARVAGDELFACCSAEEVAHLLGCRENAGEKVFVQLEIASKRFRSSSPDSCNENSTVHPALRIVKPDPAAALPREAQQPVAAADDDSDAEMDADTRVIIKPERAPLAPTDNLGHVDAAAAPRAGHGTMEVQQAEPAIVKRDPAGVEEDEGEDGVDPMDAEIAAEEAAAASAQVAPPFEEDEAVDEEGNVDVKPEVDDDDDAVPDPDEPIAAAPGTQAPKAEPLVAMVAVELPEDEEAQLQYMKMALAGLSMLAMDIPLVARSLFKQIGPAHQFTAGRNGDLKPSQTQRLSEPDFMAMCLEKNFDDCLKRAAQLPVAERRDKRERLLEQYKGALHSALGKPRVQEQKCLATLISRLMPQQIEEMENHIPGEHEHAPGTRRAEEVLNIPGDLVERLWGLWQQAPYLCTLRLPVVLTTHSCEGLKIIEGVRTPGHRFLHEFVVGKPVKNRNGTNRNPSQKLHPSGENLDQTTRALELLAAYLAKRHDATRSAHTRGGLTLVATFAEDSTAASEPDIDKGDRMRILNVDVHLDVAMCGASLEDGVSGFFKWGVDGTRLVTELLLQSEDLSATDAGRALEQDMLQLRALHKQLDDYGLDQLDGELQGEQFGDLLKQINNSREEFPDDLKERLAGVITLAPHDYQCASIAYMLQEEGSPGGLQRHMWRRLPLLRGQQAAAFIAPDFDAIWVADTASRIYDAPPTHANSASYSHKLKMFGRQPRGGMLALEMGTGKTLCVIAVHALEQHELPDKPAMHTDHTGPALKRSETVYVGKRYPGEPERAKLKETEMFTGFKQKDDGCGTIVPDGSITFTGGGNLVVAPAALAPQWESEIKKICTRKQKVLIVDDLADRRRFLSTVDGMLKVAAADWVITTPGKFAKDAALYNAITWRRVIADEAHQLVATIPAYKGCPRHEKDNALMSELGTLDVSAAHWCLSGTPLKNFRTVSSMDRVFNFLSAGFTTPSLTNLTFVDVFSRLAIRYTKAGNIELPPLTDEEVFVELGEADRHFYTVACQAQVTKSGVPKAYLANLLKPNAAPAAEDSDDDYQTDAEIAKKRKSTARYKLLSFVVDPLRRVLSCGAQLFVRGELNEAGAYEPVPDAEHTCVGEPPCLKKPRALRGERPLTRKEWEATDHFQALDAQFTKVELTSKIDAVVKGLQEIFAQEEEGEFDRPVKVIIFSNFAEAFKRIVYVLDEQSISYGNLAKCTNMAARRECIDNFVNNPAKKVFLLNKASGAVGLNLTVATHIVILESSWNPVWEDQAISRAHRLGQQGPIHVIRYVCTDTVESRLRQLMQEAHAAANDTESQLESAVMSKGQFVSDESALNETVTKLFDEAEIAHLIGTDGLDLEDTDDEDAEAEGSGEDESDQD